jgi:acyl-CoA synthetase (AMP-forming)/AMP-acid ligase II
VEVDDFVAAFAEHGRHRPKPGARTAGPRGIPPSACPRFTATAATVAGGENVYPAEVGNARFGHPCIADVAVAGVPDDNWGEMVQAIIVLKPGADLDMAGMLGFARQRIAGYKLPKSIDVVDALPRNASGKVLGRDLREQHWRGCSRHV